MQNPLISAKNITYKIDNKEILKNISLSLKAGQIITIIGPNGSGKTTLTKILLGLIKPTDGNVELNTNLSKIGYMPQKIKIDQIMPLNIYDFLELVCGKNGRLINFALKEVGLEKIANNQIHGISGGQMQRLLLAAALLKDPEILILDEPVQGVDVQGQIEFYQLIEKLKKKQQIGIIMISHDLHMVMKQTDHVICLNGHICCEGTPEEISKHSAFGDFVTLQNSETDSIKNHVGLYKHSHNHSHDC